MMEWGIKDIEIRDSIIDVDHIRKEIRLPIIYDYLTKAYIKVNARMKNSTKIEDAAVITLNLYSIMPVFTVSLTATPSGDESIALATTADDGGYGNVKEYRYSYALAGQSKTTWVPLTSWVNSANVTFTPSLSGDYLFKVEVRSKGRLGIDAAAEATNESSGYYLESLEDMTAEPMPEPEPSPAPTPSPTPTSIPSAAPSVAPSVIPSATPVPISSLEYAINLALGEGADLSAYTETEVALEDLLGVLKAEDAPTVIVQLGENAYAVITGYTADETGTLISLTLTDAAGETILGGTEGILRAWTYVLAEPVMSETPSAEPSAIPSAEVMPEPKASIVPAA